MKYQCRINRKLVDQTPAPCDDEGLLAGPCWPDDGALPRVVRRHGEVVLDEGWVRVDDHERADGARGSQTFGP